MVDVLEQKILLVGCGKMGGAMVSGWISCGIPSKNIMAVSPLLEKCDDVRVVADIAEIPSGFVPDIILFAVKPQLMDKVAPAYKRYASGATFLSIAAGKTIGSIADYVGDDAAIVRTMPNLPATISKGVTVAVANAHVSDGAKNICENLLQAIGACYWLDDEELLDAVTAISGSGPAYVFLFIEALTQAAQKLGLPKDIAEALAIKTVEGSAILAAHSDEPAAQLRQNVTSREGTTAAALDVLMGGDKLQNILCDATLAASKRAKELN